ncbi:MAG: gamma-glutamyl-gamma-aminobutyrate hydrolase family protein, partial [Marinobacter sp.]|nr:gamma-glutamyl-gamma-aminobutyrate hydrolase family protein [Marinobacter sp.]
MPKVVILKTGTTYPALRETFGDFDSWFAARLAPELDVNVVDVTVDDLPGRPEDWDGVVITGSPAMVSDREPWSEHTGSWLADAVSAEIPLLGVCYGHQLLAHALGGEAGFHPRGRETGTHPIELLDNALDDPLFKGLPRQFPAQLTPAEFVATYHAAPITHLHPTHPRRNPRGNLTASGPARS